LSVTATCGKKWQYRKNMPKVRYNKKYSGLNIRVLQEKRYNYSVMGGYWQILFV